MLDLPQQGGATRLVLVRHAETEESASGRLCGRLDVALSAAGRRHARALARSLAGLPLAAVYASPLARALATARPLAAVHRLQPVALAELRELDFGALEGLPYEEIEVRHPGLLRAWREDPAAVALPGGETLGELRARVLPILAGILERHEGDAVAVVAHGGVVRVVLAEALGLRDGLLIRLDQSHGGVSVVDWDEGVAVVRVMNANLYSRP